MNSWKSARRPSTVRACTSPKPPVAVPEHYEFEPFHGKFGLSVTARVLDVQWISAV
jgi:hypothetical protein